DCDLAVIDEAHQLEDVVTQYFGVSVTANRVEELVRDVGRAAGMLRDLPGSDIASTLSRLAVDIQDGARRLFDTARMLVVEPRSQRTAPQSVVISPTMGTHLQEAGRDLD